MVNKWNELKQKDCLNPILVENTIKQSSPESKDTACLNV